MSGLKIIMLYPLKGIEIYIPDKADGCLPCTRPELINPSY